MSRFRRGRHTESPWCARSLLNSRTKSSKRACCCRLFMPGGRVASFFRVHALMAAVLLRMPWLDARDSDAEPEPPDGELRQVEQCIRAGEGNAIVGADGLGQAALCKQLLEGGDGSDRPIGAG